MVTSSDMQGWEVDIFKRQLGAGPRERLDVEEHLEVSAVMTSLNHGSFRECLLYREIRTQGLAMAIYIA